MSLDRDHGKGWVGVDFDGTLAQSGHDSGPEDVGLPIEPMVRRVRKWIRDGRDVRLLTARKPSPTLRRWMREHLGAILPITNKKDHDMQFLVDDRAVHAERDTGKINEEDLQRVQT